MMPLMSVQKHTFIALFTDFGESGRLLRSHDIVSSVSCAASSAGVYTSDRERGGRDAVEIASK